MFNKGQGECFAKSGLALKIRESRLFIVWTNEMTTGTVIAQST
jgi:hypothetical protein